MQITFTPTAFKENTELSNLATLQAILIARDKRIAELEKDKKNLKSIIRAFNGSNTKQNSI